MTSRQRKLLGGFNRFRLILTLGLAVLLPAVALIYVNYSQLKSFERDKVLEAAIHRDFGEMLAITEKKMNKKMYAMAEEVRNTFPSPDDDEPEIEEKIDKVLSQNAWATHAFIFNEDNFIVHTQRSQSQDKYVKEEREKLIDMYKGWFHLESKQMVQMLHKRSRPIIFYGAQTKRADGPGHLATAVFVLPNLPKDRNVIAGISFDPCYVKSAVFAGMLDEQVKQKADDQGGTRLAMMIYPAEPEWNSEMKPLARTDGWGTGKPEVARKMDEVFRGLMMGIKYQGTSVEAMGRSWMHRSLAILGCLSLLIIGGLVLTRHIVNKEMALARLKSDFVSNVSHELRTPLALIRLYAETLELGRISTKEKKQQYYRIIRKESERLTALINNILDFSRIEAGRKEYEFRETNIADLVHNTLDSYRYQIEAQGFDFEEKIDQNLPPVYVDREAIARAVVNLVNNALKYSDEDKFLGVRLYRDNGSVKLEVVDHGIGIDRRDQTKIFEKFYRTGDPLVHNTKGSGLGLSLVRHITHAHGGKIEVESTPGKGSKFIMSLPVADGSSPRNSHEATQG
jgi:signal transduction histidine kinase